MTVHSYLSIERTQWALAALVAAVALVGLAPTPSHAVNAQATITINVSDPGIKMSPDLYGVFYEDISFGADGGLYAEMVQNRSFDYSSADRRQWDSLTSWSLVERGGGSAAMAVETAKPLHPNNPSYLALTIKSQGEGVGVSNSGFFGISVKKGEVYDFSFWARRTESLKEPFTVQLETADGQVIGQAKSGSVTAAWKKYTASITATGTDKSARLVVLTKGSGIVYMDMVSLFPRKTWNNRPNGLRYDLAKMIADLKPRFVRFPGGCVVHGDNVANSYRWKDSIGPVEERKANFNRWDYHQTYGLGFHEYFQYCEDIGAKPVPILPAGVSCQFEGIHDVVPMDQMGPWVQDALDLIEYANGPVTSKWGAKRAANGHPKPFNLEYIGIGNEEHNNGRFPQGDAFKERFPLFIKAIREKYPNIKIISHAGPYARDNDGLWAFANEMKADLVDEHYYMNVQWFLNNSHRYDDYGRSGPRVMAGEYASQGNALINAVAEASYMTGIERNSDVVQFAAYAPLLCNVNNQNWSPNLIWFDNATAYGTPNYHVQKLYSTNIGDTYLPSTFTYTPVAAKPYIEGSIGVATWGTHVEFDDVAVTAGENKLFADDFSADAARWSTEGGQWAVSNGVYAQTSNRPTVVSNAKVNITGQSSYTYTVKARKTSGTEGFLIVFGKTGAGDYYWWNMGGWGNTRHALEIAQGGSRTPLSTARGSINTDQWYSIKIQIDDMRVRCYLDDALIHDVTIDPTRGAANPPVAVSVNKVTKTGDLILKLVNPTKYATDTRVDLKNAGAIETTANLTVLTGESGAMNSITAPNTVVPVSKTLTVGPSFDYTMPAWSVNVITIKKAASAR